MSTPRLASLVALALGIAGAPSALAQEARVHLGVGATYLSPAGSLGDYVGGGYGVGAALILGPERRALTLRIDAEYLRYPATTRNRPYTGITPAVITTGSSIFAAMAGPRLRMALGRVHLSAGGSAGFARLMNTGSVSLGPGSSLNRATTFDNLSVALGGGAGASVRLGGGEAPVRLELSSRYLWIGPSKWLREGNLPVGTISGVYLNPTWSAAGMWVYRLAISVGLRH